VRTRNFIGWNVSVHFSHSCFASRGRYLFSISNLQTSRARCQTSTGFGNGMARRYGKRTARPGSGTPCAVFKRRLRAMGIRDRSTAPRSPWQNGHAERLIGSIRRDCLDHIVVFGEQRLRHLLKSYQKYYNEAHTHLSLYKDAPIRRAVQTGGRMLPMPILGGLPPIYIRV
jgi:Integrase core domain